MNKLIFSVPAVLTLAGSSMAAPTTPSAAVIVQQMLESDPWGLSGASVAAHAVLSDKAGAQSELAFSAKSRRLAPSLAASLVRFSAPPDLAGAGFLQIQKKEGDDDRMLFLPDLGRARRISGNLRSNAFMGTDMSFADLDRRDLRDGTATLTGSETLQRWDCFVVNVVPKSASSQYSRVEIWVRKDNHLPLKMNMFDRSNVLLKTFAALEVKRVGESWFISRSRMTNVQQKHSTELVLDKIVTTTQFGDEDFTVRELEKSK